MSGRRIVDSLYSKYQRLSSQHDSEVEISACYLCRLAADGSYHNAEVIAKRYNAHKNNVLEYYVDYKGLDRRMDDWIDISWIDLTSKIGGRQVIPAVSPEHEKEENVVTRRQKKRKHNEISNPDIIETTTESESRISAIEKEHEQLTRIKYISEIQLGKYFMKTWYFSPFPDEYGKEPRLYICEFCLYYMRVKENFQAHYHNCKHQHPPGKRIYQKADVSVYEVDGVVDKMYCQNLCLLAKLFLDHKTLYYDVKPFLFYVMTEEDGSGGSTTVGYFSKEKESPDCNNVACILILPPFQRKSYGKFLISFSYELSKIERKPGSPEKPLSDLGRMSYLRYWKYVLLDYMNNFVGKLTLQKLTETTSITHEDLMTTLHSMGLVKYCGNSTTLCTSSESIRKLMNSNHFKRPRLDVDPKCIQWKPNIKKEKEEIKDSPQK